MPNVNTNTRRDFFNDLVDLLITTGRMPDGKRHTRRHAKAVVANLQSLCLLPYADGGETLNGPYLIAHAWKRAERARRAV